MSQAATLRRTVGTGGAVLLGLGSMVGTGIFVSVGLAAGAAGPLLVPAILLAALVAGCNALSSAQLAAAHPVSGGTYEYGYRLLSPPWGVTAGVCFLAAKGASAAVAALGCAGYLLRWVGVDPGLRAPVALGLVALLTLVVAGGLRRSNVVNAAFVGLTLLALAAFVLAGAGPAGQRQATAEPVSVYGFAHAAAIMFVAFTGYGRLATLGEEVVDPARTIPRAIGWTMLCVTVLYAVVAAVAVGLVGGPALRDWTETGAAPLAAAADSLGRPGLVELLSLGAISATVGVLLNLILGLSRVVLAMARRRDLPSFLARLDGASTTPTAAVIAVGLAVGGLAAFGRIETTWSFSAFCVLVYYAITNACALRLPPEQRRWPRATAWVGLTGCVGLAWWVEPLVWQVGGVLVLGTWLLAAVPRRVDAPPADSLR